MPTATIPRGLAGTYKMARDLMDQYGLEMWVLRFTQSKKTSGVCRFDKKEIALSAPLMRLWPAAEQRDTVLHEIAHALTPGHGHDARWQAVIRSMGGRPQRCSPADLPYPSAKYIGICPRGHTLERERIPRSRFSCGRCAPRQFDVRYLVVWTRNPGT